MNTVNSLLEGASPYQVQANQAAKLAGKWDKSGLLEGIGSSTEKNNMAMLLENQAKQLVNEANTTGTGTSITTGNSEAWAGVALPLVRRVFGEIVAKDLVSVQPMNLPAGLIFYLDFQYGDAGLQKTAGESLYGATSDLKRTDGAFDKGLYGAGEYGYTSYTTSSIVAQAGGAANASTATTASIGSGTVQTDTTGILLQDSEFMSSSIANLQFGGATTVTDATNDVLILQIPTASLEADFDKEAIKSFNVESSNATAAGFTGPFPKYTRLNPLSTGEVIEFVVKRTEHAESLGDITVTYSIGPDNLNNVGDFEDSAANTTVSQGFTNSSLEIPTIDVKLQSDTVAAKTRKLKAQWTPEFAQDLNAYHSIDAEAELTSILSEYISMEIDLEILDMLMRNADTVEGWSARVGHDISISELTNANTTAAGTDMPVFSNAKNTEGVYYTKMSWFQTLGVKLQKVSNIIHQKTLRGGANWMVISPKMSTVLESIPGFAADTDGSSENMKYNMGVQKMGAINNRYTVYKNPYMTENVILMGYKGSQFLETGAVFAPYIPLIMTPLVYDPSSFTPRKGIMTRYAKKMVRPDFYGKVVISDMDQI
ncbi:putative major head protein [uncultured virus]|uniref:Putative major head protein n=1 Tax=uncultured virus TaxID=340016 RepID=A0A218MMX3_9VIRU|nr:putative major head protein [uncultured virus]